MAESQVSRLCQLAEHLLDTDETTWARDTLRAAHRELKANRTARNLGWLTRLLGNLYYRNGDIEAAARCYRIMEHAYRRVPSSRNQAVALYNHGLCLARLERSVEAGEKLRRAAAQFSRLHRWRELGVTRLAMANVLMALRAYALAQDEYERAQVLLRGDPLRYEAQVGKAICVWSAMGADAARHEFTKLLASWRQQSPSPPLRKVYHNVAVIDRQRGALHLAVGNAKQALAEACDDSAAVAATTAELALCTALLGNDSEAIRYLRVYEGLPGPKDPQDDSAMAIVATGLGVGRSSRLPHGVIDDYEKRTACALDWLISRIGRPT